MWTSHITSNGGLDYYALWLDYHTHYLWVYPLKQKSQVFDKFLHLSNIIKTQFGGNIKEFQCDNRGRGDVTINHFMIIPLLMALPFIFPDLIALN